ncbi:hypothetical protein [Parafilimonas sp.]|uniref:hypothetical protein n=1 Tax=Parafilimonas sp. TaxID=1969739 RepID=UPI0039E52D89
MRKLLIICFFIIGYSCVLPPQSSLEEIKKFYIDDFIVQDSTGLLKRAQESGLLEKLKNAPSRDSFGYYWKQFRQYNDSVANHDDSVANHKK